MRIALIGSGNVAFHLANEFARVNVLAEVRSRNAKEGKDIAQKHNVPFSTDLESVDDNIDIIILAVSDDAVKDVAANLKSGSILVAHTSGSKSIKLIAENRTYYGSFYPLQTFTKERVVDFNKLPILICGSTNEVENKLMELGALIGEQVQLFPDSKRAELHAAAVVTNNFTNHLIAKTQEFCDLNQIDFKLLKPLLQETIAKLDFQPARTVQTGPAKRKDKNTIKKHVELIEDKALKSLYKKFSKSIKQMYD